ncbi:MAG: hypothetical protein WCJ56_06175 [bacterium]
MNVKRWPLLALGACIAFTWVLSGCGGGGGAAVEPGKIAFISSRSGQDRIYTMDFAGGNVTGITVAGSGVSSPSLSPDETKVAYVTSKDGNAEIYVANVNNTGVPLRITNNTASDVQPAWSPDGLQLAWTREANDVVLLDTIVVKPLTGDEQELIGDARNPAWSATGEKLAFTSRREGAEAIYLYTFSTLASSKLMTLPQDSLGIDHLSWSAKGSIAYGRYDNTVATPASDIYTVNTTTGITTPLINTAADEGHPAWSASGDKLVYYTNADGNYEIYSANADGTGPTRLTNDAGDDGTPGTSRWRVKL